MHDLDLFRMEAGRQRGDKLLREAEWGRLARAARGGERRGFFGGGSF